MSDDTVEEARGSNESANSHIIVDDNSHGRRADDIPSLASHHSQSSTSTTSVGIRSAQSLSSFRQVQHLDEQQIADDCDSRQQQLGEVDEHGDVDDGHSRSTRNSFSAESSWSPSILYEKDLYEPPSILRQKEATIMQLVRPPAVSRPSSPTSLSTMTPPPPSESLHRSTHQYQPPGAIRMRGSEVLRMQGWAADDDSASDEWTMSSNMGRFSGSVMSSSTPTPVESVRHTSSGSSHVIHPQVPLIEATLVQEDFEDEEQEGNSRSADDQDTPTLPPTTLEAAISTGETIVPPPPALQYRVSSAVFSHHTTEDGMQNSTTIHAEEWTADEVVKHALRSRKVQCTILFILMVIVGAIVGAAVGITVARNSGSGMDEASTTQIPPTQSPSAASFSGVTPSEQPLTTSNLDVDHFVSTLPAWTQRALLDSTSYQSQALQWLLETDDALLLSWPLERLQQRFALATFFLASQTNVGDAGQGWIQSDGWMTQEDDVHECEWFQQASADRQESREYPDAVIVTGFDHACNPDGQFIRLNMAANRLGGTLPPEIALLSKLQVLDLQYNLMEGDLPAEMAHRMTDLQEIWLLDNFLNGPIPHFVFDSLPSLKVLDMEFQYKLDTTLPTQIGKATSLEQLYLDRNKLKGTIPTEVGSLENLHFLSMTENMFDGSLPTELGQVSNMEYLFLGEQMKDVVGPIPTQLGNLTQSKAIVLGDNALTGNIPSELGQLTSVSWLDLGVNYLTGTIPVELFEMTDLTLLYLDQNQLSGPLPTEIGNLHMLDTLLLDSNQFLNGTLPTEIGQISQLSGLQAFGNSFTGTLPSEIAQLSTNVWLLELHDNKFTLPTPGGDAVPAAWGSLTQLVQLTLYGNPGLVDGRIPDEVCALKTHHALRRLSVDCTNGTTPVLICACCDCAVADAA